MVNKIKDFYIEHEKPILGIPLLILVVFIWTMIIIGLVKAFFGG